jgi:hypothetical protein
MTFDDTDIVRRVDAETFHDEENLRLWQDSKYLAFKRCQSGKQRGTWGERYFSARMAALGCDVMMPDTTDCDRIVNGTRIEIKTWSSDYDDVANASVNICQIRPHQDYDIIVAQMVTPKRVRVFVLDKQDIWHLIRCGLAKNQHGGSDTHSGTYICATQEGHCRIS